MGASPSLTHGRIGNGWWVAALLTAPLVLAVRSLSFESVFVGDDVLFSPADTQYHLRRAFGVFQRFPSILLFDPYINHPGGAPVPWPPLFDWTVGALARLLAGDQHGFEVVAAWVNPVCGTLVAWPIALVARRGGGRASDRTPALAVAIYALIPVVVGYSRVGLVDHHAAVALVGGWLMWCCTALVDPSVGGSRRGRLVATHVLVRWALLLTWHGSLLYLAVAEATLALAFAYTGRRRIAFDQAVGALATAILLAPVLVWMPEPLGGPYSSIALSRLHVLAMLAVAGVAGGAALVARRPSLDSPSRRILLMLGIAMVLVAGAMLLPGARNGLLPAYQFLSMTDAMGDVTAEQVPLFAFFGRESVASPTRSWGWLGFLIPLAPVAAWWCGRRQPAGSSGRAAAWVVALWATIFAGLAMSQRRYGNDFGPAASVAFAFGFATLGDALVTKLRDARTRRMLAIAIPVALVIATAWPSLNDQYRPRVKSSWAAWRGDAHVGAAAHGSVIGTLVQFLAKVRRATPETAGYFDETGEPEYGVIATANLGHAIQYIARRPTATDPFWSYIGPGNWDLSAAFFAATDEREALEAADALRGRYVITQPQMSPRTVVRQLHVVDGSAAGDRPALTRFRLVEQAPAGAPSLWTMVFGARSSPSGRRKIAPYKLFEIVPGAVIEVPGEAGELVSATLDVEVLEQRVFVYRSEVEAGADGLARLRVPYAAGVGAGADGTNSVRARGSYRVQSGARRWSVDVSEQAVRSGAVLTPATPPGRLPE